MIEESTDADSVQAFVGAVKFRVIHGFDGFGHLFYANNFTVIVVLTVLLIFKCFGTHALMVGCTRAGVNVGVHGWLLGRRIVWSTVLRRKG